jgi:hypothetical protein
MLLDARFVNGMVKHSGNLLMNVDIRVWTLISAIAKGIVANGWVYEMECLITKMQEMMKYVLEK